MSELSPEQQAAVREAVDVFVKKHRDYLPSENNRDQMRAFLEEHALDITVPALEFAFAELSAASALEMPEPAETPSYNVTRTLRSAELNTPENIHRLRVEQTARELAAQKAAEAEAARLAAEAAARKDEGEDVPIGYDAGRWSSLASQQAARRQPPQGVIPRGRQALVEAGQKRAEELKTAARTTKRRHL